jgi:hypothetical protein
MANEAVIIELLGNQGDVVRYTVADAATIEKGTLGKITDPRTAVATGADNDPFSGIAASEKVINDGSTTLGFYTHGIFDLKDSGAGITVGERVSIKGANVIAKCAAADLIFSDVGIALETAGAAEVIAVLVGSGF